MVVCENGRMRRGQYRRFRVKGAGGEARPAFGADDFAAMREVVERRYRRVAADAGPWPDLIVIDGGPGQLGAAYEALAALDLAHLVAVGLAKIIDTEATIEWDAASNGDVYKDWNEAASITIEDADENLNCNKVEYVPFFVLVNPGSWNQITTQTPDRTTFNSFCSLKWNGGYDVDGTAQPPINWFNIYEDRYIHYPRLADGDTLAVYKTLFDTNAEWILVTFFAKETGVSTGVFKYNFNQLGADLGFNSLNERDVLAAYYLDPNDEDDFKLTTAYIGEKQHSLTSFTDASRAEKSTYWLGRDAVYVQVIDDTQGHTLLAVSTLDPEVQTEVSAVAAQAEASSGKDKKAKATRGSAEAPAEQTDKASATTSKGKTQQAVAVGQVLARRALAAGIKSVVFDRGGYMYHGRVKALAEAARKGGLDF